MKLLHTVDRYARAVYAYWLHRPRQNGEVERVSWGEDFPDKTFLVIRRFSPDGAGLLSFFNTNRSWIWHALNNGMIPVVDMQTYLNPQLDFWEVGRKNAWELYFEQPSGYSLDDIVHAKNVVIANATNPPRKGPPVDWMSSPSLTEDWRRLVREHMKIKHDALSEFDNPELETALSDASAPVIGVLARGTDYTAVKPHGHTIQPTAKDFIEWIGHYPPNWKIYLVTEDAVNRRRILDAFGNRVILSKQQIPEYNGGYIAHARSKSLTRRQEGAGYLKAIYDLSRCPILVSGQNNGMIATYLLSSGFKEHHIFDFGKYP